MKWLIRIPLAILVLLLIGVGILYFSLNGIVKSVVEKQGTEQLKVPTTLGGVTLGIFQGSVNLDALAVGSPPGFTEPQMFSVGKLAVATSGITHLRDQPIHISSIAIDSPRLVIEQNGKKLNFRELMDRLPSQSTPGGKTTSTTPSQGVKVVIDTLTITNPHVLLHSNIPGLGKEMDIAMPTMTMQNIGTSDGAQNGVAIKDVVIAVISKMVSGASGSSGLPINVQGLLSGNLSEVKDKLTGEAQRQLGALKLPSGMGGLLDPLTGSKGK